MGKGENEEFFRIYTTKTNEKGEKEHMLAKAVFTNAKQAAAYCEYLNQPRNHGGEMFFSFRSEKVVVYKNANDLVKDENEDTILFS